MGLALHLLGKCCLGEDGEGRQVAAGEALLVGDEGAVPLHAREKLLVELGLREGVLRTPLEELWD